MVSTISVGEINKKMSWMDIQCDSLSRLIRPEWHYADIGACVGEMTDFLWPKMERGHLFEASPLNYEFLVKKYHRLLAEKQLTINNFAVTKKNGRETFSLNTQDKSTGNLRTRPPNRPKDYQELLLTVDTVNLDTYFEDKQIDLIKMDVEGAEWDVFEGAKEIMSARSIVFQVEFHWDEDWSRRSILKDLNYNIYTSREWMGGNKVQKAFAQGFFEPDSSSFRKLENEAPRPYQGIVAKEDEAVSALLE
jgi:FkbM family methyltransferase